jgi:hypothetical protein
MDNEAFPWRRPKDIETILLEVKPVFVGLGVVTPDAGCSESEVAAAEHRSQPFPREIRAFYCAMRPTELFSRDQQKEFGFYTIGSSDLAWKSMQGAEPADDWVTAQGLCFGQSAFGDPFWWVKGHRSAPDGAIFLLDHDGGLGGDIMFVHFSRSLSEFLAKLAYFKNLHAPKEELFRREYIDLNPSAKM